MTEQDWRDHADLLNRMAKLAHGAGVGFAYHCHPFDFTLVDGKPAFHRLAEWTDPALVDFELDCGWAAAAGFDPAAEINRLGRRCRLLHLKDWVRRDGKPVLVPLGEGQVPLEPILSAAAANNVAIGYVEQDPPSQTTMMMAIVEKSFAHLRAIGALTA
jgi:sugar phosphate isomerase/epimerase